MFATLDTKISKLFLNNNQSTTIIDTVGFISNIPTQLIDAFKATLEEVNQSDILINVVDINDENFMEKIKITKKVLLDTGVDNEKISNMITVFNKVDKFNNKIFINSKNKFYVSALKKTGIENLRAGLSSVITE